MSTPSKTVPPPAGRSERVAVWALTLAGFGIATNVQVLGPLGPFLIEELQIDKEQFSAVVSTGWLAAVFGALILLPVVDRIGRRLPLLVGLAVFAVASVLHLAVDNLTVFHVVRAVAGFAGGAVFTIASATVADLVPYERRGAAMGVFNLSLFLAIPLGMPVAVQFAKSGAWEWFFVIQAVTSAFAVVGLIRAVPAELGRGGGGVPWGMLRDRGVVAALLSMMLYSGVFATVVQLLGVWLDESGLVPKGEQHGVWIGLGLLSAVGTVLLGRYADRLGKRPFVLLTSAVVGAGFFALPYVGGGITLLALGVPIAMCTAARSGAMLALVSGLVPAEQRGSLLVVRSAGVNLGMGVFVWLGGMLYHGSGFEALAISAGAVIVVSLALVFSVKEVGR